MPTIQIPAMPSGTFLDEIETLLPSLGRFENLQSLAIADISTSLKFTFPPAPLPQSYFGPPGQGIIRNFQEDGGQGRTRIVGRVFVQLPWLDEFWIGDCSKAFVVRSNIGNEIEWEHQPNHKYYRRKWYPWVEG